MTCFGSFSFNTHSGVRGGFVESQRRSCCFSTQASKVSPPVNGGGPSGECSRTQSFTNGFVKTVRARGSQTVENAGVFTWATSSSKGESPLAPGTRETSQATSRNCTMANQGIPSRYREQSLQGEKCFGVTGGLGAGVEVISSYMSCAAGLSHPY